MSEACDNDDDVATRRRRALVPVLGEEERTLLERWAGGDGTSRTLPLRSRIVLGCAAGKTNLAVANELGTTPQTVGKWRSRFLRRGLRGLEDEPRPGAPLAGGGRLRSGGVVCTTSAGRGAAQRACATTSSPPCATTGATMLTRAWALELAPHGIHAGSATR
jgi:hypothetical protein